MKKKVAFYLPSLNGGGAERVVVNVLNELATVEEIEFLMVVNKKEGVFVNQLSSNIRIFELKTKRMRESIPALLSFLKKEQPEVLISGMGHVNLISIIANQLTKYKTKIVVTEHNNLSSVMKNNNSFINFISLILLKKLYPKAEKIVSVSKDVQNDLCKYIKVGEDKLKVIYNPVVSDVLYNKAMENIEHPWIKSKEVPVIVAIGRLTDQKDFKNLIQAFSIVKNKLGVKLIILGEGEKRSNLEKMIQDLQLQDSIDLYGFEKNPYKFLANADLYVLSSKYEGLPTVLIEALALNSNIVSTDCPSGPREILRNGLYGRLVEVGNPELLAEAIIQGLQEPMNKKSDVELEEWVKQFEAKTAANNYLKLIREIL